MTVRVLTGDCRDVLPTLPAESVHCVVTSPPYWGLRDYGTAKWEGGDAACDHVAMKIGMSERNTLGPNFYLPPTNAANVGRTRQFKSECGKCGARRIDAQIGLEPDFNDYIATMVAVFREVRRVLRKDGTVWLNLGDSYAGGGTIGRKDQDRNNRNKDGRNPANATATGAPLYRSHHEIPQGLKPKDLCGIPWRVAFALQADGWYLRQDIIWSKPNPMPESVRDRCCKSHEYLFLLSKSARYYYDAEAIREPQSQGTHERFGKNPCPSTKRKLAGPGSGIKNNGSFDAAMVTMIQPDGCRNKRSVWEVATQAFSDCHFATFPPALIEPCIKAGASERGCCAQCGAPWVRDVQRTAMVLDRSDRTHERGRTRSSGTMLAPPSSMTLGWSPSCACDAPAVPCTVLDPFGGAGTTGLVADRLQRNAILIDLSAAYSSMARYRITEDAPLLAYRAAAE